MTGLTEVELLEMISGSLIEITWMLKSAFVLWIVFTVWKVFK